VLRLRGRAATIREEIAPLLPLASPADAPMVDTLAFLLAQLERASMILGHAQMEEGEAIADGRPVPKQLRSDLSRLAQDARGWANSAARLADQLGLTPTSRARLGFDVIRTRTAVEELNAYLEMKADAA
jgi:ATP phosphoribosyltransferase regulatory subunit HisZ